ncbi:MAG: LytTR family DNA-binding domain-containing protein [Flavobacteriaceae bacterium]
MKMNLISFLNTPFPRPAKSKKNLLWVFLVGLGGSIFILLYNPFGIRNDTRVWYVDLVILGIGALFVLSVLFMEWFIPSVYPRLFRKWTLGKALLWYALLIVVLGANNFLYKNIWGGFGEFTWHEFFLVLLRTLGVGIVVTFFVLGIWQYFNRNRIAKLSSRETYRVTTQQGKTIDLNLNDIFYISSDDNYVDVHYRSADKRKKIVLRSSLKNIESQIVNPLSPISRCHRRYLINTEYFIIENSNLRSMTVTLRGYDDLLPVSKQYARAIKKKLSTHP